MENTPPPVTPETVTQIQAVAPPMAELPSPPVKRKAGRPKGSTNKVKSPVLLSVQQLDEKREQSRKLHEEIKAMERELAETTRRAVGVAVLEAAAESAPVRAVLMSIVLKKLTPEEREAVAKMIPATTPAR